MLLEWRRKRVHLLPALIPLVMLFIDHEDPLPWWNLAVAIGVVTTLTLMTVRLSRYRAVDRRWTRACAGYAAAPLAVLVLFPARAEYASATLYVLAFGDAAAALCGRAWGRRALPWNPGKTWVGTVCFVAAAAPLAALIYHLEARPQVPWSEAGACAVVGAVCAACAESLPSQVNDNLRVGAAAAVGVVAASLWWG
ncbi:MAG: hypothetical protein C4547_14785 [Phycisphaerales bacterium]|nr:MAG: hypothetical protein C4547_14785 [Phycisphaerales bacterium]